SMVIGFAFLVYYNNDEMAKNPGAKMPDLRTVTVRRNNVTLNDIFISIKTSKVFHQSRVVHIVKTWFNLVKDQTYIFTDGDDDQLNHTTHGHMINTRCGEGRTRPNLGCKMGSEFDAFLASGRKWWCRFDDDNYVNPARLLQLVNRFNWWSDVYIGRLSVPFFAARYHGKWRRYKFAHGGAGCCISRSLGKRMEPWGGRKSLPRLQNITSINDDAALGFIITAILKVNISLSDQLHSHYERLADLNPSTFSEQVSFSYSKQNTINTDHKKFKSKSFSRQQDPTRFYSLHCLLYPAADICQ
uniref:Fringe-like glycosyltransferase domain-containing protein n=1 Tax=Ciona savignyi TaxID=51511 RepID=H2ZFT3_CIOSA